MKVSHFIGIGALCVGLYGCGGSDHGSTPMTPPPTSSPPPPASVTFSANDVLLLARSQSETDDPQSVNGGDGGSITGSDETSDPMAVE
jgi:hypothetical protein